jgi:hypothetical protein
LGRILCWEQQFGYTLGAENRNLDALRDGFDFTIPEGGGQVLEILGAEMAWREDRRWLCGLLAIAQEQSRQQLALGRRFFVLLVLPERSPLVGEVIEQMTIPGRSGHRAGRYMNSSSKRLPGIPAEPLYGLFCQQAHREQGKNSFPSESL